MGVIGIKTKKKKDGMSNAWRSSAHEHDNNDKQ